MLQFASNARDWQHCHHCLLRLNRFDDRMPAVTESHLLRIGVVSQWRSKSRDPLAVTAAAPAGIAGRNRGKADRLTNFVIHGAGNCPREIYRPLPLPLKYDIPPSLVTPLSQLLNLPTDHMNRPDHNSDRRVAITGAGIVCSAGRTAAQVWESLTSATNQSDSEHQTDAEVNDIQQGVADFSGSIHDFGELPDDKRKFIRKAMKLMNRETQLGVSAGQQALTDSGALEHYSPDRFGVCFGSDNVSVMPNDFVRAIRACSTDGRYDVDRWGTDGIEEMAPLWLLKCLPNMPACHLAIINDLRGPSNTITQRDISANLAVAEACRAIRAGDTDAALAGATGTTLAAFNLIHAQLDNEVQESDAVCRPFDKRRKGPAPGEGAGAVVLEDLDSAVRRGAQIYGEILGAASASHVGTRGTSCCRKALASAIRQVLKRTGQSPESIGHIHAHGLGTRKSDIDEAQAIREVFGDAVSRTPVVAARSHLAHTAAGAGALDLVSSLLAMQSGRLFPVLNYRVPDPACPVRPVVGADDPAGQSFLNLSMLGRGLASCVAVGAYAA
jgi:3-oxoacyl-[acyl-carrier-protein] synthase II